MKNYILVALKKLFSFLSPCRIAASSARQLKNYLKCARRTLKIAALKDVLVYVYKESGIRERLENLVDHERISEVIAAFGGAIFETLPPEWSGPLKVLIKLLKGVVIWAFKKLV